MSGSFPQNSAGSGLTPATGAPSSRWQQLLPLAFRNNRGPIVICHDNLGKENKHGQEQRYVSPTTGICRRLVVQAVHPTAPHERPIKDHTGHVSQLALWLVSTNPFQRHEFWRWAGTWLLFTVKLLWSFLLICALVIAQLAAMDLPEDFTEDSEAYNTGRYKPYERVFSGQLWEARSKKEFSARDNDEEEKERRIITHSLYPRLLVIYDRTQDAWSLYTDPNIIIKTKYLAISYPAADVPKEMNEEFIQEVRLAARQQKFDAYWLDLECIGHTKDEKNLDLYCMSDVYRGAESTLIMLDRSKGGERAAWERWGGRVWTFPEALLSKCHLYKFRDSSEINSVSLRQLANLAYPDHNLSRDVINAYNGKDPLERLDRLSLLKSAIWRRGIKLGSVRSPPPVEPAPFLHSARGLTVEKAPPTDNLHAAERVYALMGFFGRRIQPNYAEDEPRALARLSMANDSDRIAERMVSLLPDTLEQDPYWYADHDVYHANLWDILPEIQVAGVTRNAALVLDGCRAAAIRWKDFPVIAFDKTDSLRRTVVGFLPYLAWPIFIVGIALVKGTSVRGGIVLLVIGGLLILGAPRLFVISEAGRVVYAQPWFIGVKGVLDKDTAAKHLYGGANKGHHQRIDYTPSGSEFAVPAHGPKRKASAEQYDNAKAKEAEGVPIYTLIDTSSGSLYYFRASRPPTVCLFTGREGGLGRFVLCSEWCQAGELQKETVLRMPTEVSQKMQMCGWVALR